MGSPTIFSGSYTKLLTSGGVQMQNGMLIQNDGNINYIKNGSADVNTTGWATYADAAGNIPVDGTGGTATSLTFSRSTSSPLVGSGQFSMVQANSTSLQGKGVSYDFTIDPAYKAQVLQIKFNYNASSTFVASNGTTAPLNDGTTTTNAGNSDIEVFIYDITNSQLIYVTPQVLTANGANNQQFSGTFQTASNSTSYRLIFHVATTSANATGWTFLFDGVSVGPQLLVQGAAMTDAVQYTPTFVGAGTPTNVAVYSERCGDKLKVWGNFTTGTVTGSTATMTLGFNGVSGNVTIDTSKLTSSNAFLGRMASAFNSSTYFGCAVISTGANTYVNFAQAASTTQELTAAAGTTVFNNTTAYSFAFEVPILGWSSNVQMSNGASTNIVAASYYASANNASSTSQSVNFDTKVYDTNAIVTASAAGTGTWKCTANVSGYYQIYGTMALTTSSASFISLYKNGSVYIYEIGRVFASDGIGTFNCSVQLNAGDYFDIRLQTSLTVSGGTQSTSNIASIFINRLSGPATLAADATVACKYTTASTTVGTSDTQVVFSSKVYDTTGSYSSGTFTAPISGKYSVKACVYRNSATASATNNNVTLKVYKNGSLYESIGGTMYQNTSVSVGGFINGSTDVQCVAGDTISIYIVRDAAINSSALSGSATDNVLSIVRVGN